MARLQTTLHFAGFVSFALAQLVTARARAQAPSSLRGLEYVAPPECPDETAFRSSLGRRMGSPPESMAGQGTPRLHVSITARDASFVGELRVADADGAESNREVTAARCEEVADALAFLAAVTLGLGADARPTTPPSSVLPVQPPAAPVTHAPEPRHRWRFGVGSDASVLSWPGPSVRLAPEPFLEVRREGGVVTPTIRLSGTRVTSGTIDAATGTGTASLSLTAARLQGCPVVWQPASTVRLLPCLGVRGGVLEAAGANVAATHTEDRAWLSAELLARAEWAPFSWLFLELEGGASLPLVRYRFYFDPDVPVTETAVLGGFAGVGGGLRFPW